MRSFLKAQESMNPSSPILKKTTWNLSQRSLLLNLRPSSLCLARSRREHQLCRNKDLNTWKSQPSTNAKTELLSLGRISAAMYLRHKEEEDSLEGISNQLLLPISLIWNSLLLANPQRLETRASTRRSFMTCTDSPSPKKS
jgi:hypothetical protein